MEPILKTIKTELKPFKKEHNFIVKRIKNAFQDGLEYFDYYSLNRKKHYLVVRFIYQKDQNSLSVIYRYQFQSKTKTIDEEHSFAEMDKVHLPGIKKADREKLYGAYKFDVVENKIVNTVPLEEQHKIIIDVFQNNINSIVKLAKSSNKKEENPE
ncbi:MAG: hypothetical protein JXB08_03055 [Bacilli bacterium]|nr:hypothetical protein [Bacilli bacterium]MBN2876064.1 hypothetical protein [Bacilli bacterium]